MVRSVRSLDTANQATHRSYLPLLSQRCQQPLPPFFRSFAVMWLGGRLTCLGGMDCAHAASVAERTSEAAPSQRNRLRRSSEWLCSFISFRRSKTEGLEKFLRPASGLMLDILVTPRSAPQERGAVEWFGQQEVGPRRSTVNCLQSTCQFLGNPPSALLRNSVFGGCH